MKLLCIGDIHFTIEHPISRDEQYPKDILKKLAECITLAKKMNCDNILCTGDFFHRKAQASFYEANILMSLFRKSHIPFYGIAGNHDIAGYNLKTIASRALGALTTSGHMKLLDTHPIDDGGLLIAGNSHSRMYDVSRMAYFKAEEQEDRYSMVVTHGALILKDEGSFWGQYTNMNHLREIKRPLHNIIFNGHTHHHQALYKFKDRDCTIFSIGSLARNILKEDVARRRPKVLFLEIKDGDYSYEEIELKSARTFEEAFIIPEEITEDESSIKDFVATLVNESGEFASLDDKDLIKITVKKLGYCQATEDRILTYIDQGETT